MSFFIFLSLFGVLFGVFLITQGLYWDGIGPVTTFIAGAFFTIKEIMDMIFAG